MTQELMEQELIEEDWMDKDGTPHETADFSSKEWDDYNGDILNKDHPNREDVAVAMKSFEKAVEFHGYKKVSNFRYAKGASDRLTENNESKTYNYPDYKYIHVFYAELR